MVNSVYGAPNLSVINAVTQFVGATQAVWNSVALPIPAGLAIYAVDTTVVKIGDGATLYSNLPVLFTLNSITGLAQTLQSIQSSIGNSVSVAQLTQALVALASSTAPQANGVVNAGQSIQLSRADHVHPRDTGIGSFTSVVYPTSTVFSVTPSQVGCVIEVISPNANIVGPFTLNLPAAGGVGGVAAGNCYTIMNLSGSDLIINAPSTMYTSYTPQGGDTVVLPTSQTALLVSDSTVWIAVGGSACVGSRRVVTGGLTLYVTVNGNDAGGDGSLTRPFATPQAAISYLVTAIDLKGGTVDINIGPGRFPPFIAFGPVLGQVRSDGDVTVSGAGSSTIIDASLNGGNNSYCVLVLSNTRYTFANFAITGPGSANNGFLLEDQSNTTIDGSIYCSNLSGSCSTVDLTLH